MSEGYAAKDAAETTHTTNTSDSAKADEIEARDFTDIFRAAIKGSLSAVQHFLRLDPQSLHSTNAAGFTILHEAARRGHNNLAQLLLQKAASVNATTHTRETPLHMAAMKGYVALAEQLLAARARIDAKDDQGYDAYTFATINDQRPMKRLLRPVDAVINNCGDLAEAARDGNVEAAEHFVKVSPESINSKDIFGLTPLHDAAERGYPGVAKVLLEARASIHDKTNTSCTPLHWAAENGHPSVAKLLLEARAYTEAKNQWGLTPLHETARQGHAGVAQLLLPAGADIEAKDGWGRTPLHWAPQLGHLHVAQLLLGHSADLKATDRECLTPLHFAAQSGRCDAVEMLLDQNADASVQDRAGDTPYDKAESDGHFKVMELLGSIHVALPSGRSYRCRRSRLAPSDASSRSRSTYAPSSHSNTHTSSFQSSVFGSFSEIREEAEQQLGQRIGYMVTSDGQLLCNEQTLAEAIISAGDTVTAVPAQPLVMFALYETREKDVYEKMLAVEQCLNHRGVNTILHNERKTQSELNEDLERLKNENGVLLHVASAGFAENTDLESCHELNYALDNGIETLCLKMEEQYLPEHRKDTKKGERVSPVERMLAAADVVHCVGLTAEDIAMQLLKHVTAPQSPKKRQVFVSLLSGKTCGCIYYEERSIKELKEEVEQELGVTIQHLIGSSMEPLTESEHFEEANILPNSTVTAIIAAAQPPVMFALYKTHEKDVYEKMLAVEQSLMRSGVNAILHDKRKTQSELNKDLERLKSKKGVLLHVASAGFTENTDLESCHELKYALDNNIETLCLKTEEQYSPEHRKDTKKGQSAGPVESMLAAADVVNCVGLTAEDIAKQLANHVTAPKKGQAERTIAGTTKKEAQEKEGVISSLEKDCKEMKAEVEVLSTKLLDSQQAADNHNEGAKELQSRISTLEEELASARREGESLQGAEADLKSTLAQKEFALLDALASSEARRANEAALRSALQNQEKLLADERVAKAVAERHLAERVAQMVDLQEEIAEMLDLQSKLRSSEVALNAKLEETAHSESSLREKLQAEQLRKRIPRSNSEGPESLHWPAEARRASCTQAVRQNLSQGSSGSDGIPEAYLRVMQQIDQIGWDNMCWGRGFTLLHWAAKHDRADLCELFLWHGADPGHRDDSNRSALDYARLRQPQALAALEVLQKGKPMQKPVVQLPTACESEPHRELPLHLHESQKELHSFVAYEQDGVLLEMAESTELQYKPRLEISKKLDDKIVSMLPDGVGLLSPIVSLTPEGEKFNPPIRCIFPACNGATKAFRATAGRLEELEEAIFRGGYCEVSLNHFSCVLAGGSPLPLVARGYLKSESNRGKIGLSTLNCEHCEKIVKNQEDFEEGVNSFRACGEPVVLGLTSLNESVKLLHDKTELKIEQVDPTCPRLPPFVSTDFLIGGPEPENGAFTIQVERDSTVTYKHLFQFSFPTMHAEPQASSSTGPNQMVPSVLGMPERTHLMLSGRFSTPEKCEYMKSLKGVLEGKGVHCYLVEAGPGDEFGFQTMEGLACAKAMLAVCCEEYGAYTGAGYETYYEVRYAWDNRLPIIPLRLCEVYPPQPDRAGAIQNGFVFHKSLVRIEGRGRSIQEVAVDIEKAWKRMAKLTRVSL